MNLLPIRKVHVATAPTDEEIYYRVIAGSFTSRNNAETRKRELESKGFSGIFLEVFGE